MKKLLILLLLLPSLAWGSDLGQDYARMNPYILGGGVSAAACADSSCTGFLVCQNFEAGDNSDCSTSDVLDNSETWTCDKSITVIDTGNASSPLRGTKSLFFDNGAGTSALYYGFTASDEVYAFVRTKLAADVTTIITRIGLNANSKLSVGYNSVNNKLIYNGATLGNTGIDYTKTLSIWLHYKKGEGGAGIYQAAVAQDSVTYPGSWNDYDTTHSVNDQVNRITLENSGGSCDLQHDQVLVKTTAIGTVCE